MTKINEKFKKVARYAEETRDEDYEEQLEIWGRRIIKAETMEDYRNMPMTQEIVQNLIRAIKVINQKLIYGEDEVLKNKRAIYIADKQRCLWLVKILSYNYQKDLKLIEMAIDNEINELGL